jgi:hypothetical protein
MNSSGKSAPLRANTQRIPYRIFLKKFCIDAGNSVINNVINIIKRRAISKEHMSV